MLSIFYLVIKAKHNCERYITTLFAILLQKGIKNKENLLEHF